MSATKTVTVIVMEWDGVHPLTLCEYDCTVYRNVTESKAERMAKGARFRIREHIDVSVYYTEKAAGQELESLQRHNINYKLWKKKKYIPQSQL